VIDLAEKLGGIRRGETIPASHEQALALDDELSKHRWSGTGFIPDDDVGTD
jgi:hypothetical protein